MSPSIDRLEFVASFAVTKAYEVGFTDGAICMGQSFCDDLYTSARLAYEKGALREARLLQAMAGGTSAIVRDRRPIKFAVKELRP